MPVYKSKMNQEKYDLIVIGAGLVGLSTAYQFKIKNPFLKVLIIEKEDAVSKHQSGNNSGVIHSGIYYKPGSLKAKNCIEGYNYLVKFANENGIPFDLCGKLIVATSADEFAALDTIYNRGVQNQLRGIKQLVAGEIAEYEPHCAGIRALFVPQTGIIDYPKLGKTLLEIYLDKLDGKIKFSEEVINIITNNSNDISVETKTRNYITKNLVSCAGLQSDRISNLTQQEKDLCIIPFRGEYYLLKGSKTNLVKNLIYPVPDPKFPFLGVHFTRMINGGVEAGPNAVLAFKREGYKFSDISLKDMSETLSWPGFWKILAKYGQTGMGEIYRSLSKQAFTTALQKLIPEINKDDLIPGGAGVRAQACDKEGNLIDDFNFTQQKNIIHVRNAPSPAATSCLSIGKYISEKVLNQ